MAQRKKRGKARTRAVRDPFALNKVAETAWMGLEGRPVKMHMIANPILMVWLRLEMQEDA